MTKNIELKLITKKARKSILHMIFNSGSAHIGSCFSVVDILTVVYSVSSFDNSPSDNGDVVLISKGHAAAAVYSVLAHTGKIPLE